MNISLKKMFLYIILMLTLVCSGLASSETDQIVSLPGLQTTLSSNHYSGYLNASGTKKLHYWLVESQGNPAKDPLVLWLNGGPGCSSLEGLFNENGPYKLTVDIAGDRLIENQYSWNKVANMLYLEAPAGVGFSYSDDKNYTTGDDQVAQDNYLALKHFLAMYPKFVNSEFFITGESYGGIYVPTLATLVATNKLFNFKGFAVGNGISDIFMNSESLIFFGFFHGLWGLELWNRLMKYCCHDMNSYLCNFAYSHDDNCKATIDEALAIIGTLNVYNLYGKCYGGSKPQNNHTHDNVQPFFFEGNLLRKQFLKSIPPCIDGSALKMYLNRKDVRRAIHINDSLPMWDMCSSTVSSGYQNEYHTVWMQYWKILDSKKQRILVYNGDVDMACNFMGDEWFVDSLAQKIVANRTSWYYTDDDGSQQIGGFIKQFLNLNFVTVRGAGHMVPQDKPIPALYMFTRFLQGKPL